MTQHPLFTPFELRDITLRNRVVVPPMHQYSAVRGHATPWHTVNIGRFAAGGAGLVFVESTKVERRGAGTIGDLGLWNDAQIADHRQLVDAIRRSGSVPALQLGHTGRKARRFRPWEGGAPLTRADAEAEGVDDWDDWSIVGPSPLATSARAERPAELSVTEIQEIVQRWADAARRADEAGYDVLEIHGAHGYLIHQFLSPWANERTDVYGGSEQNRMRFAVEVIEAVRSVWPSGKPLFLRLSVEDDAGWGVDQSVRLAKLVGPKGVDVIDCSSGGMKGAPVTGHGPVTYGYQVPYAEQLKRESGVMTMAVGLIVHASQAEQILRGGQADLVAVGRESMYNPNWALDAARKLQVDEAFTSTLPTSQSYWLGKRAAAASELEPSTYRRDWADDLLVP